MLTGSAVSMATAYIVVTLHEFAHFCAARRYRIGVSGFVIMPFGVCLRLKENHIKDPLQEKCHLRRRANVQSAVDSACSSISYCASL